MVPDTLIYPPEMFVKFLPVTILCKIKLTSERFLSNFCLDKNVLIQNIGL